MMRLMLSLVLYLTSRLVITIAVTLIVGGFPIAIWPVFALVVGLEFLLALVGITRVAWSPKATPAGVTTVLQTLTYWLARPICSILGYQIRRDSASLRHLTRGKVVIAANHWGWGDTFVAIMALPAWLFFRLVPFRFAAKDTYVDAFWKKVCLFPMGAYPAKHDHEQSGLEIAIEFMARGQTIFIFPEGRISNDYRPEHAKIGVAYLASKTGSHVVPIGAKLHRPKRGATITVGEPLTVKPATDLQPSADAILAKIYHLGK